MLACWNFTFAYFCWIADQIITLLIINSLDFGTTYICVPYSSHNPSCGYKKTEWWHPVPDEIQSLGPSCFFMLTLTHSNAFYDKKMRPPFWWSLNVEYIYWIFQLRLQRYQSSDSRVETPIASPRLVPGYGLKLLLQLRLQCLSVYHCSSSF